jgi:hypothetical protein
MVWFPIAFYAAVILAIGAMAALSIVGGGRDPSKSQ